MCHHREITVNRVTSGSLLPSLRRVIVRENHYKYVNHPSPEKLAEMDAVKVLITNQLLFRCRTRAVKTRIWT
ncbi:hypothetical protein LINPERPRIM_LOCUS32895 [Linum perenne]